MPRVITTFASKNYKKYQKGDTIIFEDTTTSLHDGISNIYGDTLTGYPTLSGL